jgi:hypothetical protein
LKLSLPALQPFRPTYGVPFAVPPTLVVNFVGVTTMPPMFCRFAGMATSSLRPYLPVSVFSVPTRTDFTLKVGSVTSRKSLPPGPL